MFIYIYWESAAGNCEFTLPVLYFVVNRYSYSASHDISQTEALQC